MVQSVYCEYACTIAVTANSYMQLEITSLIELSFSGRANLLIGSTMVSFLSASSVYVYSFWERLS